MSPYLPLITELAILAAIWITATLLTSRLRRRLGAERTTVGWSAHLLDLVASVSRPLAVVALTLLVLVAARMSPDAADWLAREPRGRHFAAWETFWVGVAAIELLQGLGAAWYRWRERPFPLPDLLLQIVRAVLFLAVAFLVLKVQLEIDIGPLLASTALVTAVVGFALQGVLGNLLAGISLHLVHSLEPGVWVDIDGLEGRVVKTNWRETRLRTRGGHLYILPNSKVAEARIHNMQEPTPLRRHIVAVGASYSDAPDAVIAALVEAARDVEEVRKTPPPQAHITAYLDFGINYELEFWTLSYHLRRPIDGKVNRMIWYRFKRAGIEIPFPMSDKLLNDFMAVVYNQRKLPPTELDLATVADDLARSDLARKLVVDEAGAPLLTRADLEEVAPLVRRLPFTTGESLCRQGEAGETFWIVARGRIDGVVEHDGQTVARFSLGPGAVVGEMGALTGVPRSATLTIAEPSELLELAPEAFRALLALHDTIPERLSDLAAGRVAANRAALEELARSRQSDAEVTLERTGILRRLLRMIGR